MKLKLLKKLLAISVLCLSTATALAETVNINDASAAAIAHYLNGIGKVKAKAIVDYREANGDFKTINDIVEVKGIGEGLLKKNLKDLSLTEGVVKWIKAKPRVVAIDAKKTKQEKSKKLKLKKVASKGVTKEFKNKKAKVEVVPPGKLNVSNEIKRLK